MRVGFSSNAGIDVVVTALVYTGALLVALLIREAARARIGGSFGDRVPALAGRASPGREIFDPVGSYFFPLFMAAIGAISYGWATPLSYDHGNSGPPRRLFVSALSGPGSNLLVAALAARFLSPLTQSILAARLLGLFVLANVTMAIMHLMPVPHLDGGRILMSFLTPQARASYLRIEPWSVGSLFGVGLLSSYVDNWPFTSIIRAVRQLIT